MTNTQLIKLLNPEFFSYNITATGFEIKYLNIVLYSEICEDKHDGNYFNYFKILTKNAKRALKQYLNCGAPHVYKDARLFLVGMFKNLLDNRQRVYNEALEYIFNEYESKEWKGVAGQTVTVRTTVGSELIKKSYVATSIQFVDSKKDKYTVYYRMYSPLQKHSKNQDMMVHVVFD